MKFVLQIIKTPQNIFKNFHFKFLKIFYIPIADKRIHEPRKDSLEQPSRITRIKSETLEYLGGNVTMSCILLKKKKCWSTLQKWASPLSAFSLMDKITPRRSARKVQLSLRSRD